jgi:hypothetical protein
MYNLSILTRLFQDAKGFNAIINSAFFLDTPGMQLNSSNVESSKNDRIIALSPVSSSWKKRNRIGNYGIITGATNRTGDAYT